MKLFRLLLISIFIISTAISYANSAESLLFGKWFYASGNIKDKFYKRYIEFTPTKTVHNQNGKLGTYQVLNDSTVEIIGYQGDSLFSMSVTEQMLILVDLDQDTTIFLKKEHVYPSKKGVEQKSLQSDWHLIYTWDDDADTLKFDKNVVTSNRAIRNNNDTKTAIYRCINNRFIEFIYKNWVFIGEYHIFPEYMEVISPFSNGKVEGFIEITDSPQKFNKKLAKKLFGSWISNSQKVTFSNKGVVLSKGDSVGTYTVLSDTLLYFGDKMRANFMWYNRSKGILTVTENSHGDDGDVTYFLNENALLSTEKLKQLYNGDWQIVNPTKGKNTKDTTKFFLSIEGNERHTYRNAERLSSSMFTIDRDRIISSNRQDTTFTSAILLSDTLFLSNQMKLVKCKKSIKKEPHEHIYNGSLPMLNIYKVLPDSTLSKWLNDILKTEDHSIEIISAESKSFIKVDDSLALAKLIKNPTNEIDSTKILIGKRENNKSGDQICPLYLIKIPPSVKGTMVETAKVTSLNQNSWFGQNISIKLNDIGKKEFESLTKECIKKEVAIVINGVLNSAPTVVEPIPGGEFVISIPMAKDDRWQDGIERLKKWGLE